MPTVSHKPLLVGLLFFAVVSLGASCNNMAVDQSSPEKAVQTFYDALHNHDTAAALVVVPDDVEQTSSFKKTWNEIKDWTFNTVTVSSYEDPYVTVEFDITVDGDSDTGSDEVKVQQIDGKWWVVEVPR